MSWDGTPRDMGREGITWEGDEGMGRQGTAREMREWDERARHGTARKMRKWNGRTPHGKCVDGTENTAREMTGWGEDRMGWDGN